MIHKICLYGCDDYTEFEMDLDDSEFEFIKRVAIKANNTSTYGCMPVMYLDDELYKE